MMVITSTDFKVNLSRYLKLASQEEIIITKNGQQIAKLVSSEEDPVAIAKSLFGMLPQGDLSDDDIKMGRMRDRYGV
jgi:prevent-host-death family protein